MGDSNGVENQGMMFRWMEDQRQLQRVIKYGQVPELWGMVRANALDYGVNRVTW